MQVVAKWTGTSADALREALRMTIEQFAVELGAVPRTVSGWREHPERNPRPAIQEALDALLERASDRAKAQFAALAGAAPAASQAAVDSALGSAMPAPLVPAPRPEFGDSQYLQSAAGELAEVVGWLAYDAAQHELCRRMNQESLYFTRLSGDKAVELLTLQNSSMHAASQGHPREALQIVSSVLDGPYRLSPRLKALFLTRKARALAQGGDGSALGMLPEIRSLFLDGVSDADPAWAWWVDERELAWHEAMIQRDLGLSGQAIGHFERSVTATPADEIRSQYLHRAYLLQAQVDIGAWDAAEQTIGQLIPLSREVASTRTVVLLRDVPRQLALRAKVPPSFHEIMGVMTATLDEAPV